MSRDCLMYAVSVIALILTLQDGVVMWYEAALLILFYIIYIAVMYWNDIMSHKARTLMSKLRRQSRVRPYRERVEITPLLATPNGHKPNGYHTNGLSTVVEMENRLYPLLEETEGKSFIKHRQIYCAPLEIIASKFIYNDDRRRLSKLFCRFACFLQ